MTRNLSYLILSLLLFSGCSWFEKYPGFSKSSTGIYYKLHVIGEEVKPPKATDYVTVDLRYFTEDDSLFFDGYRTFQLTEPEFKGAIDECFLMLSQGDSASFVIDATNFFTKTLRSQLPPFIHANADMKVEIRMDEIRTALQYEEDKLEFLKWIEDFGEYEKLILAKFIQEEKIEVEPNEEGMYQIVLEEGTGKPVEPGDLITLHYEGRFLNGKFFDSTKKRKQAFEFVYGSELQVIPGIESAIGRMREGERDLVIIPSDMAWGDKGSSTGIIPPFTSVVYEIQLVRAVSREMEVEPEESLVEDE